MSTAILLSSVSTLGIFTLGWSNSSLLEQKAEIDEVFNTRMNKLQENILFENVWFGTSPSNYINVTLNNVGIIGLNVTKLVIQDPDTLSELDSFVYTDGGMKPSATFSKNVTYNWVTSETINIIANTERENQFIVQVTAP